MIDRITNNNLKIGKCAGRSSGRQGVLFLEILILTPKSGDFGEHIYSISLF